MRPVISFAGKTRGNRWFRQGTFSLRKAPPSGIRSHDAFGRQAPKHRIYPLRRQLRATVQPPGHHGHESTNDILDDDFARDNVRGLLVNGSRQLVAYQIGQYLANGPERDGTAAP